MPFKSNDALDDEIVLDGSNGFTTGIVSATRPDNISNTSYSDGQNLDYDEFGNLITRVGCTIFGARSSTTDVWEEILLAWDAYTVYWGSNLPTSAQILSGFYFDTSASERLVVAVDNQGDRSLWFGNTTSIFDKITSSSFSALAPYVYFAQLNEKLYYSDGVGSLNYIKVENTWSSIVAGRISRIDVINQGGNLSTIPTVTIAPPPAGPDAVTATATAVVANDGNLVAIIITNPGSGYTTAPSVSISGGGGAHAVAYVSLTPPPKPIFLTAHTQRLFCVSADTTSLPDEVRFSDILDGQTWDPAGSIRVGGDGDPITGLYSWFGNRLLVFKERSLWYIDADPLADPADWTVALISGNIGCVSHRSIAGVGADVLFLSRDGVRSMAQIQAGTQTDVGLPLSAPVNDIISKIDRTKYQLCDAVYWNNRYMLAIPYVEPPDVGSSYGLGLENGFALLAENGNELAYWYTRNSRVLVYHLLAKSWLGLWTNWLVTDFIPTSFSTLGPQLLWVGDIENMNSASGQAYIFNDKIPNSRTNPISTQYFYDNGSAYTSSLTTKAFNFNEPLIDKIGYNVQFSTENPYSDWKPSLRMEYVTDMEDSFQVIEDDVEVPYRTFKYQKAYNLISKGRWNSIQFRQTCDAGRMMVQSVITTAFQQSIKPEQ